MRIVFIGASSLTTITARLLIGRGHEVVIIERDKEVIAALADELDCGFLKGDGTRPAVLCEADPGHTDLLLCLTGNDQTNIIASLVGRSLGFSRVVTKIVDEEFEHICIELGLENTIIPARTAGRYLADMAEGQNILELSSMIKGEARIFSFVARPEEAGLIKDLDLPEQTRVVCLYRGDEFILADAETKLKEDDEVVMITHSRNLPQIQEWLQSRGGAAETDDSAA